MRYASELWGSQLPVVRSWLHTSIQREAGHPVGRTNHLYPIRNNLRSSHTTFPYLTDSMKHTRLKSMESHFQHHHLMESSACRILCSCNQLHGLAWRHLDSHYVIVSLDGSQWHIRPARHDEINGYFSKEDQLSVAEPSVNEETEKLFDVAICFSGQYCGLWTVRCYLLDMQSTPIRYIASTKISCTYVEVVRWSCRIFYDAEL